MLGPEKARDLGRPVLVSLEVLVPPDHFYRHLERRLDLSFVRDLVRDRYAPTGARRSILMWSSSRPPTSGGRGPTRPRSACWSGTWPRHRRPDPRRWERS